MILLRLLKKNRDSYKLLDQGAIQGSVPTQATMMANELLGNNQKHPLWKLVTYLQEDVEYWRKIRTVDEIADKFTRILNYHHAKSGILKLRARYPLFICSP